MADPYASFSKVVDADPYAGIAKPVGGSKSSAKPQETGAEKNARRNLEVAQKAYDAAGNPVTRYMANDFLKRTKKTYDSTVKAREARGKPRKGFVDSFIGDATEPAKNALAGLKQEFAAMPARTGTKNPVLNALMMAGDVASPMGPVMNPSTAGNAFALATSPLTGAVNTVVAPTARGVEMTGIMSEADASREINNALMVAMPARAAVAGGPGKIAAAAKAPKPGSRAAIASDMRGEAERLRKLGVQPTLTDVSGEKGRRIIRAAGVKNPEAGEILEGRARQVTADVKPAVMARTNQLVNDPRSATQAAADMRAARSSAAETEYAPAYAEMVELTPQAVEAIQSETGMAALRRARLAARDLPDGAQVVGEIDALLAGKTDAVSGRTLDYVSQGLGEYGKGFAARPGQGKRAAGAFNRKAQVDTALETAPQLQEARGAFRDRSRAIDTLEKPMDPLDADPRDYAAWLESLPPQAREANRLAIRQQITDKLGPQGQSGFGALDKLESSQYAQQNLQAALGADAEPYLAAIRAQVQQARNASFVSPNSGSRTAVLDNDVGAAGLAKGALRLKTDPIGVVTDWLASRGLSPSDAQALAEAASDPKMLDVALDAIEKRLGPSATRELLGSMLQPAAPALPASGASNQLAPPR